MNEDDGPTCQSRSVFRRFLEELGLVNLYSSPLDTKLLCLQRLVRFFGYGGSTLILADYLSELGNSDGRIGLFMTLTLVGDTIISLFLTLVSDGIGRKLVLVAGSILMTISGVAFALSDNFWVLLIAAVLGVISPSGNEVGPFRAVEESILAHITPVNKRGDIYAWYSMTSYAGAAIGTITFGWIIRALEAKGHDSVDAHRAIFYLYAASGFVKFLLSCALSKNVNKDEETEAAAVPDGVADETTPLLEEDVVVEPREQKRSLIPTISKEGRVILIELCILTGVDSLASGITSQSWVVYFFKRKFHLNDGTLGTIFSVTAVCSSISVIVASSVAKRIGNVKTMVFCHLPSGIALGLLPLPSTVIPTIIIEIVRATSRSMDTAPRSAFLAAIIVPSERTASIGIINVVKICLQSVGPWITGVLASKNLFWVAFLIAAILKAMYDLGILAVFAGHKSQRKVEEREEADG